MALKVIELEIDDTLSGETKVEEIALVLQPAIETEFVYFSQQEEMAEVGERGAIVESKKAPKSDTPNPSPKGEGTAKGDASSTRGAEVSERVEGILKEKSDDFNERYKDKLGYGVNVGMLKSVYQRGVGAYNVSHSPRVRSAEQWALARVNAFLYLVKNGRPENSKYKGDNDLLPTDHPKRAEMTQESFQESYSDYPEAVKNNAKKVLKWTEENGWGSCGTPVGKQRANQLAKGEPISMETIERMYSYLSRHKVDLESSKSYDDGCGLLMYDSWGGQEALGWAERKIKQFEEMGYDLGNLSPYVQTTGTSESMYVEDSNCGCGCWNDGTYPDPVDNLYFGITTINGMPVFNSPEEAATYAQAIGCNGSHKHIVDGVEMYMPCEVHPQPINEDDETEYYTEEEFEAATLLQYLAKTDYEKFEAVVGSLRGATEAEVKRRNHRTPTIYFKYERVLDGFPDRDFCVSIEDRYFRRLEIDLLRDFNTEFGHNREPYSKWLYKGGPNCVHAWRKYLVQGKDIVDQGFAEGKAGTPPKSLPNSGYYSEETKKRSERAYAISQSQKMSRSASQAIVVDVDDTLIRGGAPIKKTVDYINRLWDNNRIVVVSGRQSSRTGQTRSELERAGVKFDEIHLSDFPEGPNASREFKIYKVKKLLGEGYNIVQAIENDSQTRREYTKLGVKAIAPTSLSSEPDGFNGEYALFKNKKDAEAHSEFCGCGGYIEEVIVENQIMFQSCGEMLKRAKEQQFKYDGEKRMIYSPAMKPGILIPRIDEVTREKYFVTFKPETIEKMAQRYMIDKRSGGGHTNYEHSEKKFDDVYLVESWIVDGEQDKAYALGYTKEQVPPKTWMVGFRVDSPEVWKMVKEGKIKGISIEGNFEYKFSSTNTDEYLLNEIINIINQMK